MKHSEVKLGMRVKMQGYSTLYVPFLRCAINDEFDKWYCGTVEEIESDFRIGGYVPRVLVKFDDKRLGHVRIGHCDLLPVTPREDVVHQAIEQKAQKRWKHLREMFQE